MAINLVKPKYFDDHKKKATSKVSKWKWGRKLQGKSSQNKVKTSQLTVNQNNTMTDSEGDDDGGVDQMDVNNELIRDSASTCAPAADSSIHPEVQQNMLIIASAKRP